MDGIVEQYISGQFGLVVLLPVIAVVAGVILVFAFGFKRPAEPRFKKSASSESSKKIRRKGDKKQSSPNGHVSSSPEQPRKDKQVDVKKSPVKETKKKETQVPVAPAAKTTAVPSTTPTKKSTPKQPVKIEKLTAKQTKKQKNTGKIIDTENKPDDYDDGNWLTVSSKSDKKKKTDEPITTPKVEPIENIVKTQENFPKIVKSPKIPKDEPKIEKTEPEIPDAVAAPQNVPQPMPVTDEDDKQTAEIIEQIEEAIVDVVDVEEPICNDNPSPSPSPPLIVDADVLNVEEKVNNSSKSVDSNIDYDPLGDSWTEAKAPKKGKKKVRKD